jgi:RimJ/RimL family protein N-acetyltransferase
MLTFTTARDATIEAFLSVSATSPYQARIREYLESLLQQRCTNPGWCVLGLEAGVPSARAALWAMPDQAVPTDIVLIEVDWSDEDLTVGQTLLANVHELAAELGAEALAHSVDSPPAAPQYQEHDAVRIRLLEGSGYELLRDGLRWAYQGSSSRAAAPERALVFRTLSEVGDAAFVDAMAATYEGTRDSWIKRTVDEQGRPGAARADFLDYREMEHRPEWWELAYTAEGALAGVIMAARNPSTAVIAYVGVVPEHRGRGLAVELVRRGTERLVSSGASEIRGDCDRGNVGMVKAFERAGYDQFARRRTFHRTLASAPTA